GAETVVNVSGGGGGGGGQLMAMSATVSVSAKSKARAPKRSVGRGVGYGSGSGSGSGYGGGSGSAGAPPPAAARVVSAAKAVDLKLPDYPGGAKAVGANGIVAVQVTISASGIVTSARAVSGHPLLRAPSVKAAEASTFLPAMAGGVSRTTVIIVKYDFNVDRVTAAVHQDVDGELIVAEPRVLSPEETRELRLKQKFHTWLYAIVGRIEKKTSPTPNESTFVRDGQASVELTFAGTVTPKLLAQLKAFGFEVGKSSGSSVVGTIAVEKLRELAAVDEVKYVMPRMF
ncbi:MAG: energy transducer TonB, partial [Pyrinomonadaceae bacterium]